MITRLFALWAAIASSGVASLMMFAISRWVFYPYNFYSGGKPLPQISTFFYPPAILPYLFFAPFAFWAVGISFRFQRSGEQPIICAIVTMSVTIVFLSAFIAGMVLPWLPIQITLLK